MSDAAVSCEIKRLCAHLHPFLTANGFTKACGQEIQQAIRQTHARNVAKTVTENDRINLFLLKRGELQWRFARSGQKKDLATLAKELRPVSSFSALGA